MSTPYASEKAFLGRKLPTFNIEWELLPALTQLITPPLAESDARTIINQLRDALGAAAGAKFDKMTFSVNSKLRGGLRVVVSIPLLREFFAGEIDTDVSGGGRGLNPMQTTPRPPGGRGV